MLKEPYFLALLGNLIIFSLADGINKDLDDEASPQIQAIFGKENADKIEEYFERNDPSIDEENGDYTQWSDKYPNDTERLVAILKNVVANKGTFIP